jgi:hypothetical protein
MMTSAHARGEDGRKADYIPNLSAPFELTPINGWRLVGTKLLKRYHVLVADGYSIYGKSCLKICLGVKWQNVTDRSIDTSTYRQMKKGPPRPPPPGQRGVNWVHVPFYQADNNHSMIQVTNLSIDKATILILLSTNEPRVHYRFQLELQATGSLS